MGLDATVLCNRFERGRTTEPPVPRGWLRIDEDGYLGLVTEHDSDEAYYRVQEGMFSCCEHPEMEQAGERIANWPSYRLFQQALGDLGWHRFPVLHHELPEANGGMMHPTMAALALGELDEFRRSGEVGSNICLVDTATGEVVKKLVAAYDGLVIRDGRSGLEAGLDDTGFFIRERGTEAERFRATRSRQVLLEPGKSMHGPEPGRVIYKDLISGRSFECRMAVSGRAIPWPDGRMEDDEGRCNFEHPPELHVEARRERSSDFDHIVEALEKVFRASAETGNPVRWC